VLCRVHSVCTVDPSLHPGNVALASGSLDIATCFLCGASLVPASANRNIHCLHQCIMNAQCGSSCYNARLHKVQAVLRVPMESQLEHT